MSSGKKIKLTYFETRGRAEISRLILAQAGVPYEDIRLTQEDWKVYKPKTPLGQIPVLEYDGVILSQSLTVARFLAKEFELAGKTNLAQAQADMAMDAANDILEAMVRIAFEKDEEKSKVMLNTFETETLPNFLKNMEKLLISRGGKHFAGNELTWADIGVSNIMSYFTDKYGDDILKPFKHLHELINGVNDLPNIKHWVEIRPKSER